MRALLNLTRARAVRTILRLRFLVEAPAAFRLRESVLSSRSDNFTAVAHVTTTTGLDYGDGGGRPQSVQAGGVLQEFHIILRAPIPNKKLCPYLHKGNKCAEETHAPETGGHHPVDDHPDLDV